MSMELGPQKFRKEHCRQTSKSLLFVSLKLHWCSYVHTVIFYWEWITCTMQEPVYFSRLTCARSFAQIPAWFFDVANFIFLLPFWYRLHHRMSTVERVGHVSHSRKVKATRSITRFDEWYFVYFVEECINLKFHICSKSSISFDRFRLILCMEKVQELLSTKEIAQLREVWIIPSYHLLRKFSIPEPQV